MGSKTNRTTKSELIDDDVHQKLFQWFEKRGLILELRAHMRQQMVKALQENVTDLNSCRKRLSSSPKFQAMHMLIADFLLQQEHHYTVSVFSTEVPILNSLPEFSAYVADILNASKEGTLPITTSAPRFSAVDIQDILETLGLPPHTQAGAYAVELYIESGEALLTCIVRALSAQHGIGTSRDNFLASNNRLSINYSSARQELDNSDEDVVEGSDQEDTEHWTKEMREILLQSDVKIQHINKLQEKMKKFHESEIIRVRQEEASKYETLCAQQEEEVENRLREEISKQYAEQEKKLEEQRKDLHGLALQLHAEHAEITNRLSELQIQTDEVEERKKEQEIETAMIERLKNEIELQQREIEESFTRLSIDQENFNQEKDKLKPHPTKLDSNETDKEEFQKVIQQYTGLSKQLEETKQLLVERDNTLVLRQHLATTSVQTQEQNLVDKEQQTLITSEQDAELAQQLQLEREAVMQMQEENIELRAYVLQQRCRIDELTHRATTLTSQLEEAQQSIAEHECPERVVAIPPAPLLPQRSHPPLLHQSNPYFNWQPQQTGAGEESFFTPRNVPQQSSIRHEARRRPLRFNCSQNISPTSEDSSPTDEVLRDARRRLRTLEEESAAVSRSYRDFQARQLEESTRIVLNRNLPNRNRITNYFSSAPVPSQIPIRRTPAYNHLRSHTRIPDSDDSNDDDDSDIVGSRRHRNFSNRHRSITNTVFIPSANPLSSKRLYFTNYKQFSKYASFRKKFGRSPVRRTIDNRAFQDNNTDREHLPNQSERCEINLARNVSNFFGNERRDSSSDSTYSSDSEFFFSHQLFRKNLKNVDCLSTKSGKPDPGVNKLDENSEHCLVNDSKTREKKKVSYTQCEMLLPTLMNPRSSVSFNRSLAEELESIKEEEPFNTKRISEKNTEVCLYSADSGIPFVNKQNEVIESEDSCEDSKPIESIPDTMPNASIVREEILCETQPYTLFSGVEYQSEENVNVPPVAVSNTSYSDVNQELEISQSEHSDDNISVPHEDISKEGSDFWE